MTQNTLINNVLLKRVAYDFNIVTPSIAYLNDYL